MRADIELLFATPPPHEVIRSAEQTGRHGGRGETRRSAVSAGLAAYLAWPGVGLVGQVSRTVTHTGQTMTDTRIVLTSLAAETPAAEVLALVRGHWRIENRLHYVRDVTMDEDRGRWRAGAAPQVAATLRNVVLSLLRAVEVPNIAAARRTLARQRRALHLLGWLPA